MPSGPRLRARLRGAGPGEAPLLVAIAMDDNLLRAVLGRACVVAEATVVATVASFEEALARCQESLPSVMVVGDTVGGETVDSRLEVLVATGARVLVVSSDPSPERLSAALSLGATGYLFHDAGLAELANGIVAASNGICSLSPLMATIVVEQWRCFRRWPESAGRMRPSLTAREKDVLAAVVDGLSTKAIAQRLGIAVKTVECHKVSIFDKLGVRTQGQAVSVAIGEGILTPEPVNGLSIYEGPS